MARPMRNDADYFPFICKEGKTFSILRNRFPLEGIGFFTELCIILTTTPKHHIQLKTELDFEYLCAKMKCDKSKAEDIIKTLVMTGKIHKELWEQAGVVVIPDLIESLKDAYDRRANEIISMQELVNVYINEVNVSNNDNNVIQKPIKDSKGKETINNVWQLHYNNIVTYLNEASGSSYKPSSAITKKHIHARLQEGYTVEDFQKVIDKKCAEWMGTEMAKYIRPETLFGTKFESYLNQKSEKEKLKKVEKVKIPKPPRCDKCGGELRERATGIAGCIPCQLVYEYRNSKWQKAE